MKDILLQCHTTARRSSKCLRMLASSSTMTQEITDTAVSRWSSSSTRSATITTGSSYQQNEVSKGGSTSYPFVSFFNFASHPMSQTHSTSFSTSVKSSTTTTTTTTISLATNNNIKNYYYSNLNTNANQQRTISSATKPLREELTEGTSPETAAAAVATKKASSPKVEEIFQRIILLDVIEVGLLTHLVNQKMGFPPITEAQLNAMSSTSAAGSGAAAGGEAQEEAAAEEKTSFELKLMSFDAKAKIKVIKEVRAMTGLGLKEAKELVEGAADGGKIVKKDIGKEEAEEEKAKLEALGATVEIL